MRMQSFTPRCCHGSLVSLAIRDSGTSTVLTRCEFILLRSLRQSEITTARDPIQHKIWSYPCYRTIRNIKRYRRADDVHLPNIWQNVINKGATILRHIHFVALWINPYQKYQTVITFYRTLLNLLYTYFHYLLLFVFSGLLSKLNKYRNKTIKY